MAVDIGDWKKSYSPPAFEEPWSDRGPKAS